MVIRTPRREPAWALRTDCPRSEFTNEPFIDFTKAENRARMQEAAEKREEEFWGASTRWWLNRKEGNHH